MKDSLIYFAITALVLYGDLIKRILSPTVALSLVYTFAFLILFNIHYYRSKFFYIHSKVSCPSEARYIRFVIGVLLLSYIFQLFTSFNSPFILGLQHLIYMSIPLFFILVVQKANFDFSLAKLGNIFLWMIIPLNVVGLIQYTLNPSFMISSEYSGNEYGGIITRNLLDGGTFDRYPSLFTSADRYSAMGLMQFYFTWMILTSGLIKTIRFKLWWIFCMMSSLAALGIAGARSRILIIVIIVLLIFIAEIINIKNNYIVNRNKSKRLISLIGGAFLAALLTSFVLTDDNHSIVLFLQQSFGGDIQVRANQAILSSILPKDITAFGDGLGTIGVGGKPGEFGIMSTWLESGYFWGLIILLSLGYICFVLSRLTLKAVLNGDKLGLVKVGIPCLLLIYSIFAGLTAAFELSTGILIGCAIGMAFRKIKFRIRNL